MPYYMHVEGLPIPCKGKGRYAGWIELESCQVWLDKAAKKIIDVVVTHSGDAEQQAALMRWIVEQTARNVTIHAVSGAVTTVCLDWYGAVPFTTNSTRRPITETISMSISWSARDSSYRGGAGLDCHQPPR